MGGELLLTEAATRSPVWSAWSPTEVLWVVCCVLTDSPESLRDRDRHPPRKKEGPSAPSPSSPCAASSGGELSAGELLVLSASGGEPAKPRNAGSGDRLGMEGPDKPRATNAEA